MDRDYEALVIEFLDSKQLVPKFFGRFQNGLVYQYAIGSNPSPDVMEKEDVMKMIIDKLHKIHIADVPKRNGYNKDKNTAAFYRYISDVAESITDKGFDPDVKKM